MRLNILPDFLPYGEGINPCYPKEIVNRPYATLTETYGLRPADAQPTLTGDALPGLPCLRSVIKDKKIKKPDQYINT